MRGLLAALALTLAQGAAAGVLPRVAPRGTPIELTLPGEVEAALEAGPATLRVVTGDAIHEATITAPTATVVWPASGRITTRLEVVATGGGTVLDEESAVRVLPGWLTLLPPLVAIVAALLLREVILALFAGVLSGSLLLYPGWGAVADALARTVAALADPDRASIIIFSLMLGGMVGIISKNGGTRGIVDLVAGIARSRRMVQLATWLLGLFIFFDDYANSLLLGTTMRPLTDRRKVSREMLAFLVDSTAAPVASVALFSTWIGYELSLIQDATGLSDGATYALFLESLAYRFYPLLMLLFIPMMVVSQRSFGPMLAAERRALHDGELLRPGATPASDFGHQDLAPAADLEGSWVDAVLPIFAVIFTTCAALIGTGRAAVLEAGGTPTLRTVLGEADAYGSLLWAAFAGCAVASVLSLVRRRLSLATLTQAWLGGVRSMLVAFVILILAAAIGQLCKDLFVPQYTVALLGESMPSALLPTAVFLIACLASLATGSSWSTMAILTPLVAPLSLALAEGAGLDAAGQHQALVAAIAAILAGSIFGDHCSPISDTTVLSSLASSSDHVDHVRTQAPIAVVVALVSIVVGNGLTALGLPLALVWLVALATLAAFLWLVGRPVTAPAGATDGS